MTTRELVKGKQGNQLSLFECQPARDKSPFSEVKQLTPSIERWWVPPLSWVNDHKQPLLRRFATLSMLTRCFSCSTCSTALSACNNKFVKETPKSADKTRSKIYCVIPADNRKCRLIITMCTGMYTSDKSKQETCEMFGKKCQTRQFQSLNKSLSSDCWNSILGAMEMGKQTRILSAAVSGRISRVATW